MAGRYLGLEDALARTGHKAALRSAVGGVDTAAGLGVPPVAAGGPRQAGAEGGEDVEEGPGEDDVVVGADVDTQATHSVPDACPWD